MPEQTIVIAAGGTGGHLYPGIALAEELKAKGLEPVFFVRENDIGKEILDKEGFKYFEIPAMGLPRGLNRRLLKFPLVTMKGFPRALSLLRELRPKAVAGMGGYVSFPTVMSARLLGIPAVIHESNAIPGLANRLLSPFAAVIAVSFKSTKKYFPQSKVVVTGSPVRRSLFKGIEPGAFEKLGLSEGKFTVLVFGGSQGAAGINRAVTASYGLLGDIKDNIQFLHVAGPKEFEAVKEEYLSRNIPGAVIEYAHDIGAAYAVSDLIICRSGASTVAELRILNKPALVIPFPFAAANHQEYNARALEQEGVAKVVLEEDLKPETLAGAISGAFNSQRTVRTPILPDVFPQELLAAEVIKLA